MRDYTINLKISIADGKELTEEELSNWIAAKLNTGTIEAKNIKLINMLETK